MLSYRVFLVLYLGLFCSFLCIVSYSSFINSKDYTTVVFCDVGQGDGIYIRTSDKQDILIDAGPDESIMQCIQKYMPFFDNHLEAVFISHFQKDHYGGLKFIHQRYSIGNFFVTQPIQYSQEFLQKILNKDILEVEQIDEKSVIAINDTTFFKVFWPKEDFSNTKDMNSFSHIMLFEDRDFSIIFTGDALPEVLSEAENKLQEYLTEYDISVEVLKVPHHGSKNGLTEDFLSKIKPKIAIISSGRDNRYGHPSKEVIQMIESHDIPIYNTAQMNSIRATVKDHHLVLDFLQETHPYEVF